jgi:hypothetical protein
MDVALIRALGSLMYLHGSGIHLASDALPLSRSSPTDGSAVMGYGAEAQWRHGSGLAANGMGAREALKGVGRSSGRDRALLIGCSYPPFFPLALALFPRAGITSVNTPLLKTITEVIVHGQSATMVMPGRISPPRL